METAGDCLPKATLVYGSWAEGEVLPAGLSAAALENHALLFL